MSKIENYREFKKHQPEYENWKQKQDNDLQKKVNFLKTNPVSKDEFNNETNRAKIVLNAVNIMDEYSQARAEDTEQAVETISGGLTEVVSYASLGLGGLCFALSKGARSTLDEVFKGNYKNIFKLIPIAIVVVLPLVIYSCVIESWAATKQIQSSRLGRKEAMEKDLASLNQFAILTDEQQQKVDEIAKTINVSKKEAKSAINATKGLGIKESFKIFFTKNENDIIKTKIELDTRNNLSEHEILEAKKDKELIQNIVQKVDIASQDYAENAELAVSTLQILATGSGVGIGALVKYIFSKFKSLSKYSAKAGLIVGAATFIAGTIIGAKIDKEASRVGRFKAKQELLDNPEQLIYVDKDKYINETIEDKQKYKNGYISRLIQLFKDNTEYKKYIKENNVNNIQQRKAREEIELTQEQKDRALQLQKNVFNMFNKVDEKSQTYSESTEALGQTFISIITSVISLPAMLAAGMLSFKEKSNKGKLFTFATMLSSLIIPIVFNILVTKEQKKASRVASMEAIKELNDYRYFTFDKNAKNKNENISIKNMSPALKKRLNKAI